MATRKRTSNDLQNITQKTKNRATRTPPKTGCELRGSGRVSSSCSTCDTRRVTVKRHEHRLKWKSLWAPNSINKTRNRFYPTNGCKNELDIVLRGNSSGHQSTGVKARRHAIEQHEQHYPIKNRVRNNVLRRVLFLL